MATVTRIPNMQERVAARMHWQGIDFSIEFVGPNDASRYLERNTINRKLRRLFMESLSRCMQEEGGWLFTAMPLAFDIDGNIINGQHTLTAIVDSNKGQWLLVVRNLDSAVRFVLDDGLKLTAGDGLRLKYDIEKEKTIAAVLRFILNWENSRIYTQGNISYRNAEIDAVYKRHPDVVDAVTDVDTAAMKELGSVSVFAFVRYVTQLQNAPKSKIFFEKLGTDVGHEEGDPILALRRFLLSVRVGGRAGVGLRNSAQHNTLVLKSIIKAWNMFVEGKQSTTLRVGKSELPKLPVLR